MSAGASGDRVWPRLQTVRRLVTSPAAGLILVLGLVFAVYWPTLSYSLHGDDYVALLDMLTKPTSRHIWDAFTFQDTDFYWRPFGHVYYNVTYLIAGFDSRALHLANVLVFLATLVALYHFCVRFGMSASAALVAVLFLGVFPNGVVGVAWVTNGPRILAMMFFMFSMLAVQSASKKASFRIEALAWLCFVLACLSDEVSLALAPIPVLLALYQQGWRGQTRSLGLRTVAYGAVAATLIPPQFMFTLNDEPRLQKYHFSLDIAHQVWALASQLVLPLAQPDPMDVPFSRISDVQWAAGAVALAIGAALLVFGTWRLRLLVVWALAAMSPFTLWDLKVESPRYAYMASIPLAILVGILVMNAAVLTRPRYLRLAVTGALVLMLTTVASVGSYATIARNESFQDSAYPYQVLGTRLKDTLPAVPHGSRIVVHNCALKLFWIWPQITVEAEYRDPTLEVVSVAPKAAAPPARPGDIDVYYQPSSQSFTLAAPSGLQ